MKLRIENLEYYPRDDAHLQVIGIDFVNITKGEDIFWFGDDFNLQTKKNLWVVYPFPDMDDAFDVRQFKTVERAVDYAIKSMNSYYQRKLEELKEIEL